MNWYYVCLFPGASVNVRIQTNIMDSGLSKDSSHMILMEVSWYMWVLFRFKFHIILMSKLSEKGTELILVFIKCTRFSGSLVPLARDK